MRCLYVRVSSREQNVDRQLELEKEYKPDKVFIDKQSGKDFNRESYKEMKGIVAEGDEIIIKELDRLGRNKAEIQEELKWFREKKVICRILDIPTTMIDFQGQAWLFEMVSNILIEVMGTIAEQERIKIKQRQMEGIRAAKEKGVKFGRPSIEKDFEYYQGLVKEGEITVSGAVKELGISKRTWYRRSV